MDLIERKREEHRSRTLQRVGSVLVCMSLLLAVAFPPQEARAIAVVDDAAIAAIVSAFLSSCGMTFSASGMDSNGVTEQVGRVIDQYLNTMMGGKSALEWFGDVAIGYNRGKLLLPAVIGNKLADLARWVKEEYGVEVGENSVVYFDNIESFQLKDGQTVTLTSWVEDDTGGGRIISMGTVFNSQEGLRIGFKSGAFILYRADNIIDFYNINGSCFNTVIDGSTEHFFSRNWRGRIVYSSTYVNRENGFLYNSPGSVDLTDLINEVSTVTKEMQVASADIITIPDIIPDTQEVAISTGAASDLTLDDALDQILAAIAAGQLSATKEIAEAGTATGEGEVVTPVEESMPVIADLGLPELGATLTTRFPFSIPWDVTRAIKLLAAPAKTPYFEVDFFAPVADTFGGFPASTKLVLDFSQFEILGQLSRWTSTIGFCLLLASGTKKLIWTA